MASKGFTYYWSGTSNGHHVKGVAIGVSSRLLPSVVEVAPVDGHIMRLRLKHSLGFISVVVEGEGDVLRQTRLCTGSVSPS